MSKEEKEKARVSLGLKLVCQIHLMLDTLCELEKHETYIHEIKNTGNRFKTELEKKLSKFYDVADNAAQLEVYALINLLEQKYKQAEEEINF